MLRRSLILVAFAATTITVLDAGSAVAIPAFARQYDLQCSVCHTRPPRLNRFGEQFHMMGFQIPSAARPGGLVGSLKEDGPIKTLIDSLALRIEGGLFEYTESPRETETKFAPPDEITLFVARPLLPDLSFFVEIEGEPNGVVFEKQRYFTKGEAGLGKEAFFMLNLGRQLVTDQVMYNTAGSPGADFHAMINDVFLGQVGFLRENEGFNTYGMARFDLLDRRELAFNVSALVNGGLGVVRAPDPDDRDHPGGRRLDRLRYGVAANVRWKDLDVYGALIWDQLYGLPGELRGDFDRAGTGLSVQADYLVQEMVMLSGRFDQLWAGGLKNEKRDGSVLSVQAKFYPWQNIAFFVRDSVNLLSFIEGSPLRNWRNQVFVGIDCDF